MNNGEVASTHRSLWILPIIVIATFGPYLAGGIRTEQLVVYAFALPAALVFMVKGAPNRLVPLMCVWGTFAAIALFGALIPPDMTSTPWNPGSLLAGLDNVFLPIAIILIAAAIVDSGPKANAGLNIVSRCLIYCMSLNSFAAFLQSRGADWSAWWSADSTTTITAVLAESNGRYSGLINQPAEAGFLYALAGLAAFYVWPNKPLRLTIALALLIVGGAFTVSKTFLLIGIPLLLIEMLRSGHGRWKRILLVGGSIVLVAWVYGTELVASWPGLKHLAFLIPAGDQSLLNVISADRYGSTGSASQLLAHTLEREPLFGFGAAGLNVPLDSTFVAMAVYAGGLGLTTLLILFGLVTNYWMKSSPSTTKNYYGMFLLLLLASNFGISTLTSNRTSTIAWLFMALFIVASQPRAMSTPSSQGSTALLGAAGGQRPVTSTDQFEAPQE